MGKWMMTILFIVMSAILSHLIPFSSFFKNVDTMVHEFGHALVTLILSGRVMYIELYVDHSGVTQSAVSSQWAMILVALAGYVTASLFAWLLFALHARDQHRGGLILIMLVAVVSLVMFVRNGFGFVWLLGFIGVTVLVLVFGGQTIQKYVFLFIAFLSLEESVFGPITLDMYALSAPGHAGDAAVLSQMTLIPAIVWSLGFTLFSLWCAKQAIQAFMRR